jgi:mannosyltransferase OCH1-like enzyme
MNSYGLLVDSVIVCETVKNITATPFFYFENLPENFYKNGWFFVNLDYTDFKNFNQKSTSTILCKTKHTYDILNNKFPSKNIIYTGFTSLDKYNPNIQKNYRKFIHVAGKSPSKGTIPIINAWKKHPEWPELLFIWRPDDNRSRDKYQNIKPTNNIKIINKYLPISELDYYMNEYGIHICASEYEGFGHYINEARSTKAVVLYSDAMGINEFFTDNNGIPIKTQKSEIINTLCPTYQTTPEYIEKAVLQALNMNDSELIHMGEVARINFLYNDQKFKTNLKTLIKGSKKIPKIVHFIWISSNSPYEDIYIPDKYKYFLESWSYNNNESFEYNLWSGKQILSLITKNFPQFTELYKNISNLSSKCEFAKLCILYTYGGVYSDLNFFCKKDISPLLETESFSILDEQEYIGNSPKKIILTNFLATYPRNDFFYNYIVFLSSKNPKNMSDFTGPIGFYEYFKSSPDQLFTGNTCVTFPIISTTTDIPYKCRKSIEEITEKKTPKKPNNPSKKTPLEISDDGEEEGGDQQGGDQEGGDQEGGE